MLEVQFPATTETQPELVAHHYTEANLLAQALPYWQKAGERVVQRSAHVEAIAHLSKGLELLSTLPDTPERAQQELTLQIALGGPLMATKGHAAPEAERAYTRARELCQQMEATSQLFPALSGLFSFSFVRAKYHTAHELGEQLLRLAQSVQAPALLVEAHGLLGYCFFFLGELFPACEHFEQGLALYNPQKRNPYVTGFMEDRGVSCLSFIAWILWLRGYPDQALEKPSEALALAQELAHPFSLAYALVTAARFYLLRREVRAVQEQADALAVVDRTGERWCEAELYRLKGTLTLQSKVQGPKPVLPAPVPQAQVSVVEGFKVEEEAEGYFLKAIEIAQKQQAKSLELRAATSLARLWQSQGRKREAHRLLSDIYNWFTEGFDTKDLRDTKVLLDELSSGGR